MADKMRNLLNDVCELWLCDPEDLYKKTVREVLTEVSQEDGTVIYWGCWSDVELDSEIGSLIRNKGN